MGDLGYLKIMTFQGGHKTHKLKQLKPRYIGLYPSVERIGAVDCSYFISSVSAFHDLVHMTALRKLISRQNLFCSRRQVTSERFYGPYHLLEILDHQVKVIQGRLTVFVRVRWERDKI